MTHPLFAQHRATLDGALAALATRGYWSPYPEMPSPKVYGEGAQEAGRAAVQTLVGQRFDLAQPGIEHWAATERSPYGVALDIAYPVAGVAALTAAAAVAQDGWQALGPAGRVGVCLEILARLNRASFEIAQAVMLTTGQGWMMAFQAGGPHAQDRGLEAVAVAWRAMSAVPATAHWEKPQGKNPPLVLDKHFEIVGRGTALVIGCATFPTWNTYPGLFAALATGNPVIVKPHPRAVLPAALTVRCARAVLREQGLDPNVVQLAAVDDAATRALAQHPTVASVDFTGGAAFGRWLLEHTGRKPVFAELAGVNVVAIESTDQYKAMLRNLAFTLALYSGQMCTTTKAILVPAEGIATDAGRKSPDEVAADLAAALDKLLADPATAAAVLGAIQSEATLARIEEAGRLGARVVLASRTVAHPEFPAATVRTPVLLACAAADESVYLNERFGPIASVVAVPGGPPALIALADRIVREQGALTLGAYSTDPAWQAAIERAGVRARVALSLNLTGGVFVNQSAAFSDFHATGANPAANASYADDAFVTPRFCVVQRRQHGAPLAAPAAGAA